MKTIATLFAVVALSLACSKDEKKGEAPTPEKKAKIDVCAKAKKCVDGLLEADPDRAKTYQGVWRMAEAMTGAKKIDQCQQILDGAAVNPKAPPVCK